MALLEPQINIFLNIPNLAIFRKIIAIDQCQIYVSNKYIFFKN